MHESISAILPEGLHRLIVQSTEAELTLDAVEKHVRWLSVTSGNMPLFPDYTDHGISHLRVVLHLADFLIADGSSNRPDSRQVFTLADAAALTHAVLLHDSGMHLTEDAFLILIDRESKRPLISELDCRDWAAEWEQFFEEATRWDDRNCDRVFGKLAAEHRNPIRRPPNNVLAWDDLDRRLAGEFIRRNHARFAHEVALFGWPRCEGGGDLTPLPIQNSKAQPKLADLVGLVARSHGLSLRDVLPYLEHQHFNSVETRDVHAVYLMSLLRVADFLNLHAERAPGDEARLKKLASPFSRREFAAHQAIYDIRRDTDPDPEAVAIDVDPTKLDGVSTYLRLKEWFRGLQAELDHSWAILGEVYGRHPRLSQLWLMIRRVKSNLLEANFSEHVNFVTTRAAFEAGDGDFLKLLIRPLYGDVPEIGVRELIQNSVDAVRERSATTRGRDGDAETDIPEPLDARWPDSDVVVSYCKRSSNTPAFENGGPPDDWADWVEVRDRGVGMTPEIVRDYFLKAGATYRRSAEWLREYTDESGRSRILRSGRFGVGALAAFLIGDEMQVITRHYSSTDAVAFVAHLVDDVVEMRKTKHPIGTTVRIRQDNFEDSPYSRYGHDWNWYRLATPKLTRVYHGEDIDREDESDERCERYYLPAEGADLPHSWRRLRDHRFSDVQWTFLDKYAPDLTCNGICVERTRSREELKWHVVESNGKKWSGLRSTENALRLRIPKLSIFDREGRLPLNLARTGLATNTLPFSETLLEGVMRDFLAYARSQVHSHEHMHACLAR